MNKKRAKPEALAATAGNYAGLLADTTSTFPLPPAIFSNTVLMNT